MPHCFARNLLPHALLLLSLAHPMAGATGSGPAVGTTTQSPATVTAASSVWITATATSPGSLSGVSLVYDAGSGPVTVAMYDDGVHQDFAAGDGVYGAQIPALAAGTIVKYYVTATNAAGLSATDPGIVPSYEYSYTVQASQNVPIVNAVTGGAFVMGDHFNTVDPDHPSDEIPLHTVTVSSFSIGKFDVTNEQYCNYLNSAYSQGIIHVTSGLVYGPDPATILSETRQGQVALYGIAYSGITWNGAIFSVLAGFQNMPVVGVRWEGALGSSSHRGQGLLRQGGAVW